MVLDERFDQAAQGGQGIGQAVVDDHLEVEAVVGGEISRAKGMPTASTSTSPQRIARRGPRTNKNSPAASGPHSAVCLVKIASANSGIASQVSEMKRQAGVAARGARRNGQQAQRGEGQHQHIGAEARRPNQRRRLDQPQARAEQPGPDEDDRG